MEQTSLTEKRNKTNDYTNIAGLKLKTTKKLGNKNKYNRGQICKPGAMVYKLNKSRDKKKGNLQYKNRT